MTLAVAVRVAEFAYSFRSGSTREATKAVRTQIREKTKHMSTILHLHLHLYLTSPSVKQVDLKEFTPSSSKAVARNFN